MEFPAHLFCLVGILTALCHYLILLLSLLFIKDSFCARHKAQHWTSISSSASNLEEPTLFPFYREENQSFEQLKCSGIGQWGVQVGLS